MTITKVSELMGYNTEQLEAMYSIAKRNFERCNIKYSKDREFDGEAKRFWDIMHAIDDIQTGRLNKLMKETEVK